MTEAVFIQVGGGRVSLSSTSYSEFYFVETTFIFGINLLVVVPTTLRSD